MTIIAIDRDGWGALGRLYYSDLEQTVNLPLFGGLFNDLVDIVPDGFARTMFAVICKPFLRITSDIANLPFYATPEARYKFGNYAIECGYDPFSDIPTGFPFEPYLHYPEFICYPRQRLEDFTLILNSPSTQISDYAVAQTNFVGSPVEAQILSHRRFATQFICDKVGTGLQINLNPGITAEIAVSYICSPVSVQDNAPYDVVTSPL